MSQAQEKVLGQRVFDQASVVCAVWALSLSAVAKRRIAERGMYAMSAPQVKAEAQRTGTLLPPGHPRVQLVRCLSMGMGLDVLPGM